MKCHFPNQSAFCKLDTNQSQVLEYDQATLQLCTFVVSTFGERVSCVFRTNQTRSQKGKAQESVWTLIFGLSKE